MAARNMASITALEQSLQRCYLNQSNNGGVDASFSLDAPQDLSEEATLELNSHVALPYEWEQCLDLKTGEVYWINWRDGRKEREDPRRNNFGVVEDLYSSQDEDEDDDEEEDDGNESEVSSSDTPTTSRDDYCNQEEEEEGNSSPVLVVAGCKGCLMYFMVSKEVEDCPKCNGFLLHFDKFENGESL
ncbi:hypothetical protein GIB67_041847 [Kingdonia uniflora]|uniref:GIR1-like zinc ribbon domain-containing protein n=1 Tax=Kingdonia uniflora TaxID=39325 RepID=A0A7J7L5Y0_9MAGN|nr:hypothetical protein GIB67_041847 [Kingdonia uniflora]